MISNRLSNPDSFHPPPTPLLPTAIAVIAGIILVRFGFVSLFVLGSVLSFCAIISGVLILYRRLTASRPVRLRLISVLIFIAFAATAGLRYKLVYHYYPDNHIATCCLPTQPRLASIRGNIITQPYIAKTSGIFAAFDFAHEPRTILVLRCREVLTSDGWRQTQGLCQVTVKQPAPHLRRGQLIQLDCWLTRRRGPDNPGQFDPTDYQRASRTIVSCSVDHSEAVTVLAEEPIATGLLARLRHKIQAIAHTALIEDVHISSGGNPSSGDTEAFLSALLLGQRHKLSGHLYDAFLRTGTIHFLSVSGLHVGIIAGLVWCLGWLVRLPRLAQGGLTLTVIAAYLLLIPPRPPVLRAGIICSVFCLTFMSRRTVSSINVLSFAAIVILLFRPIDLFNAGFQLSFVVVLGLVLFTPTVYNFISKKDATVIEPPQPLSWWRWLIAKILCFFWGLFVVSLVAWVVGLPLSAYYFNRIAVWSALASVILYPLIALTMLVGLAKMILAGLIPIFGSCLTEPLSVLGRMVIFIVDGFERLPYNGINTAAPPVWSIAVFYILLIWAGYSLYRSRSLSRLVIYALLVWAIAFVWMTPFAENDSENRAINRAIKLHVLSVGHGTAAVVELPDGKTILYDIGSSSNFNLTGRVVAPFLRYRGVQKLDAVFISHPNIDHYNGLIDLCRSFPVEVLYLNDYFAKDAGRAVEILFEELNEMKQPPAIKQISRGCRLQPAIADEGTDYTIKVLWPPPAHPSYALDKNDSSLVLRISAGNRSILLCGDVGIIPQRLLLETEPPENLKADVLLLPHHGSLGSTVPEFIRAVDPAFCLNSNPRVPPSRLDQLTALLPGQTIYHTCLNGCISASLSEAATSVQTFHTSIQVKVPRN
ncbi:MAG: DNA internalization-related competence protein ComEC/Rec2 [Sedimentisphaerales bacterium]|nr:DNA internalization-related competence protein ComEC/Rec2 [Sedimentisphaerales bacterium]